MRARVVVVVVALGVVAVVVASVLSLRPRLSDAEDAVERRWEALAEPLSARYERLEALAGAVAERRRDLDLLDEVREALADWEAVTVTDPERAPRVANAAEGAGARLARLVSESPVLMGDDEVEAALRAYVDRVPTAALAGYGRAVERYDDRRSRFPGRAFAGLLGFDAYDTVVVPQVLESL